MSLQQGLLEQGSQRVFLGEDDMDNTDPPVLEKWQTGGQELPSWAYSACVASWAKSMEAWANEDASKVKRRSGFTETAYRLLFAYEDHFSAQEPPLLYTILPSGKTENEKKPLDAEPQKGLIAYGYPQTLKLHADQEIPGLSEMPFCWKREDGTWCVVQTWPTKYNDQWKEQFKPTDENPNPEKFNPQAVEEFSQAMRNLFKISALPHGLLKFGQRISENHMSIYEGTGTQLMALLRTNGAVRKEKDVVKLLEPDGFLCKYKHPKTGEWVDKDWYMDLNVSYVLYTKQGYETMSCVKPLQQFNNDSKFLEPTIEMMECNSEDKLIDRSLNLEWVANPACALATRSAFVVWACSLLLVVVRASGHFLTGDVEDVDPLNKAYVLLPAMAVANIHGLVCDFWIMKLCIIPMVQAVQTFKIMGGKKVSYYFFLAFVMASTCLQISTIQLNTWFLASAFWETDEYIRAWKYLFANSGWGFMPCQTWNYFTPRSVAFFIGVFASLQFFMPMMWYAELPEAIYHAMNSAKLPKAEPEFQSQRYLPAYGSFLQKVWRTQFPFRVAKYEKLFMLATASGLKYTGGFALSYPLKVITEIQEYKRGYQVMTPHGLDIMQGGWEMRCLLAFRSLQRNVVTRMFFVLLLKQALQMNLQITLFNVSRAAKKEKEFQLNGSKDRVEVVSILGLLLTTLTEIVDAYVLARAFLKLRKAVVPKVNTVEENEIYARPYIGKGVDASLKEEYTGRDLKELYKAVWHANIKMLLLVLTSMCWIGYAIMKFLFSLSCESGLWQEKTGCLESVPAGYTCSKAVE